MVDYCIAFFRKKQREEFIVCYIAECLRMTAENTAKAIPEGRYIENKLIDILNGEPSSKEPTAEEVIARMKAKMNNEPV